MGDACKKEPLKGAQEIRIRRVTAPIVGQNPEELGEPSSAQNHFRVRTRPRHTRHSRSPRAASPPGPTGMRLCTNSPAALRQAAHPSPGPSDASGCMAADSPPPGATRPSSTAQGQRPTTQGIEDGELPAPPRPASGACALPLACAPRPRSTVHAHAPRDGGSRCRVLLRLYGDGPRPT